MKQRCWLLLIWWTAATFGVQRATAVTFADGQTHVINQPSGSVAVLDSDPPDSAPTTAIIASGGSIELFTTGAIGLNAYDSSVIELAGGSVATHGIQGNGAFATHQAKLNIISGAISALGSGGVGISLIDSAQATILGGTIDASNPFGFGVVATHQAIVTVRGGSIRGTQGAFSTGGTAQLHVYGGQLGDMDGGIDLSMGGGEAHFYGSQFFLDGQPVGPGVIAGPNAFEGRLTGVLPSGEPLDLGVKIFDLGGPFATVVYIHAIPEPASLLLGGIAMLWAISQRRRRR